VPRFVLVLASVLIASAAAACGSASTVPASPAIAAAASSSQSSTAPTTAPIASAAAASASPPSGLTLSLYEWKVIAPTTIKAGKTSYTISNYGTAPHELLVFKSDLKPAAYPTDAAGNIKEEGGGVALVSDGENIDPAGSQVRTIDLSPGTYLFVCNIPGHFKQGMFTVVTVAS
jgi:uncharacterized cupredoxin-like copper-binding protein